MAYPSPVPYLRQTNPFKSRRFYLTEWCRNQNSILILTIIDTLVKQNNHYHLICYSGSYSYLSKRSVILPKISEFLLDFNGNPTRFFSGILPRMFLWLLPEGCNSPFEDFSRNLSGKKSSGFPPEIHPKLLY